VDLAPLLDELAVNATAATTVQLLDGWLLRAAPEFPFRRCNSVFANRGNGALTDDRLALVDAFYRSRGLPVRYQVSPAGRPVDLDDRLAADGYEIEAPVDILVASTGVVIESTAGTAWSPSIVPGIDDEWARAYGALHGDDATTQHRTEAYAHLMRRLGPPVVVATVEDGGAPAGLGFGVVERRWLGVFGMGTHPGARGRGVATAVLHALAVEADARGASNCYLQVEVDNIAAHAVYARAGFTRAYGYHYRLKA
jgi:GNAT superfamily N-acetyltransferase